MSDDAPAPSSKLGRRLGIALLAIVSLAVVLTKPVVSVLTPAPKGTRIVLWHSQRGAEREVLEGLLRRFNEAHAGEIVVEPLAVPEATFKDKVRRAIPHGAGPDLFIRPHNEIGALDAAGVLAELGPADLPRERSAYVRGLVDGVTTRGKIVGIPLTYKALVQFYDARLMGGPLTSVEALPALRGALPDDVFPLVYDVTSFFFHSPWFLGGGGEALDESGAFRLFDAPGRATFAIPGAWRRTRILPPDSSYNEAIRLFESGEGRGAHLWPLVHPGRRHRKIGSMGRGTIARDRWPPRRVVRHRRHRIRLEERARPEGGARGGSLAGRERGAGRALLEARARTGRRGGLRRARQLAIA